MGNHVADVNLDAILSNRSRLPEAIALEMGFSSLEVWPGDHWSGQIPGAWLVRHFDDPTDDPGVIRDRLTVMYFEMASMLYHRAANGKNALLRGVNGKDG